MEMTRDKFIETLVRIDQLEDSEEYGHYPFALYAEKDGKADLNTLALGGNVEAVYRRVKEYRNKGYDKIFLSLDFPKGGDMKKDYIAVFRVEGKEIECIAIPYSPKSGRKYPIIEESRQLGIVFQEFEQNTTPEIIEPNEEYYGDMIHNWKDSDQHCYVITGRQSRSTNAPDTLIGKVVQVRLESGDFGSDTVLLRNVYDSLSTHENQSFFRIPDKFKDYLDKCFEGVYVDNADEIEYSICQENHRKGFIVPSEVPEGESTPMRDVKAGIMKNLSKILER